jgi:hypothetical protein
VERLMIEWMNELNGWFYDYINRVYKLINGSMDNSIHRSTIRNNRIDVSIIDRMNDSYEYE